MTVSNFDTESRQAAQDLATQSANVLAELLSDTEKVSVSDAVRVWEAANKRLGLNQVEKSESLPVVHWNIIGGNVTFDVTAAPPAPAVVDVQASEVLPSPEVPTTPEAAFTMEFDKLRSLSDDEL